jgi:L-ascorbate metabolism protein UlaG (beta-lactamase superfamily)
MKSKVVLCIAGALLFGACHGNPNYSPAKTHHTPDGFRNNYPHPDKPSFWKWQWQRWSRGVPENPAGGYGFPLLKPDVAFLHSNRGEPTLTWIGHATFLLQLGGVNILTDPHLTERASPVSFAGPKRHVAPGLDFDSLPHVDVVVISHSHYDHLDLGTVRRLNAQQGGPPMFFVPLALKAWFHDQGIDKVTELDWWDSRDHMGLKLHLAPVQHWSARTPWDANETLWGSWVIEHPQMRFLFGGDFGYSQDLADIGRRFGRIDLAALPIGSYEPRWFMKIMHVNPEEAVKAHRDLNARYSVGMHWGTFRLTDERLDEPPLKLAEALAGAGIPPERFFVMKHGETRRLDFIVGAKTDGTEPRRSAALR